MTNIFTPISAVTGGKKDLKLIVRVTHIWLIRDKENPNDIVFMNMILVDGIGMTDISYFSDKAILPPTNSIVDQINITC